MGDRARTAIIPISFWDLGVLLGRGEEQPGAARDVQAASGAAQRAQEVARRGSEMTPLSFRKIGNLSSRMRLVSPEGRKIAQIGSLTRWKNP